jgi:hypothetical protein
MTMDARRPAVSARVHLLKHRRLRADGPQPCTDVSRATSRRPNVAERSPYYPPRGVHPRRESSLRGARQRSYRSCGAAASSWPELLTIVWVFSLVGIGFNLAWVMAPGWLATVLYL